MLEWIKAKVGDTGRLERIVTDYEKAVINGVKKIFPSVQHNGCQFHFRSALLKKLGEKGLQSLFYQNVNFQETMYKLYALAYVPPQHVVRFYYDLLLDYIECKIDEDEDWREMSQELDKHGLYYTNT